MKLTVFLLCAGLAAGQGPTAGSIWSPTAPLGNLARDLRASQAGDVITILVAEKLSANTKGNTQTQRKSSAKNSITTLAGIANPRLSSLANLSGDQQLQGQGGTSRESDFSTTLTARVIESQPGGTLVIEGARSMMVNSERQVVTIRGLVRQFDIAPGNIVRSERIADMELKINGKGVVADAVRRPNFLYRLLLGLLPF